MSKISISLLFVSGFIAVALGAFAAHALSAVLDQQAITSFKTGVYYQMIHTIVLLIVGMTSWFNSTQKRWLKYLFTLGMVFFSGSIYLYYLLPLLGISLKWLVFITPLGGLFFLVGWAVAAFYSLKK